MYRICVQKYEYLILEKISFSSESNFDLIKALALARSVIKISNLNIFYGEGVFILSIYLENKKNTKRK